MTTLIIIIAFAILITCIFIVQEVHLDRIKTGDYLLWYTHRHQRKCINISEQIRNIRR